jgi:HEAT repeat protein
MIRDTDTHARIWRAAALCFAVAAIALLIALSNAQTQEAVRGPIAGSEEKLARELEGCTALSACIAILDSFVSPRDCGCMSGVEKAIAANLRRFGEPARQELLRRATGAHLGWRNLAGAILSYWGDWSPSHVPAIRAALQLRHGGWIARPLAQIKTPEAIEALVEDLASLRDSANQTGGALVKIGPRVLPHLLPILADDQQSHAAVSVIWRMGKDAFVVASDWATLAASTANLKNMRLAALRGLAALKEGAQEQGKDLRALVTSPDAEIRAQAFETLLAIRDPSVVVTVAENCHPSGAAFQEYRLQFRFCHLEVAAFGEHARPFGHHLLRFLASPDGHEVAEGVTALGLIGYDAAIPQIEGLLRSPDWRVVYAAARSLGWLGATGSVLELERVASGHWLPEVRDQALAATDALKSSQRRMPRPPSSEGQGLFSIGRFSFFRRAQPLCGSQQWQWQDTRFSQPLPATRDNHLSFGSGALIGSNMGEFGGELGWQPASGQAQTLIKDNVVAMQPADGGAIVLFGLTHMGLAHGYAVHVSQRGDGAWSLSEVARLPSSGDALATIGPGLFAAWSEHRVVVFSDKGILGLASCIEK